MHDERSASVASDIREESFDDGVVLFHPGTGEIHALDPSAALVWLALDELVHGVDAVVGRVAQLVEQPAETVATDVRAVLQTFAAAGLLLPDAAGDLLGEESA